MHPPVPDLTERAWAVDSKAAFIEFVLALVADREDDVRRELANPSSPFGPTANGWENVSIEGFLESAAAWSCAVDSTTGQPTLSEAPNWRDFALFLLTGKHYE